MGPLAEVCLFGEGLLFARRFVLPALASPIPQLFEKLLISFGFDDAPVLFLDPGDTVGGGLGMTALLGGHPAAVAFQSQKVFARQWAAGLEDVGLTALEIVTKGLLLRLQTVEFAVEASECRLGGLGLLDAESKNAIKGELVALHGGLSEFSGQRGEFCQGALAIDFLFGGLFEELFEGGAGADGGVEHRIAAGGVGTEVDQVFGTAVSRH